MTRSKLRTCLFGVPLLAFPILCHGGDLTGLVLDDKGAPIAGAIVTIGRSDVDGPLFATESYLQQTQSDGSFYFSGLSAGPFVTCAFARGRVLVDPCQWSDAPSIIRIPDGSGVVTNNLQLQLGAKVSIRVDDPLQALSITPPDTTGSPGRLLLMGVWTSEGRFHASWQISSDSTGRNHILVIPPDVDVEFAVSTVNLSATDATGAVFDQNKRVHLKLHAGATTQLHFILGAH